MTRTLHIALAFLIASVGVLAGLATAQEQTSWFVASGRMKSPDGKWAPIVFTDQTRRELPEAVVRALAKADVTRDWKAAAAELDTWSAICTWKGVADRESLLEHLALRKVELYERFGRTGEALAATQSVLIPAGSPLGENFELQPATAEELALQTRVLATQYVATNRERLSRMNASPGVNDDEILAVVRVAVGMSDRGQVLELGSRAVPALRVLIAESATRWLGDSVDPLAMLLAIDEAAGAEMILEWFDGGGSFWRRRALRSMQNEHVLTDAGTFGRDMTSVSTTVLLETWWPRVLLRFLREPDSALDSFVLLKDLARGDALGEPITAALIEMLKAGDPKCVDAIEDLLRASVGREGTRKILESMLDSPDAGQRGFAAPALAEHAETRVLRAHIDSPDPAVRLAVARTFQLRRAYQGSLVIDGNGFPVLLDPNLFEIEIGRPEVLLLERLLRDGGADVRASAAGVLYEHRSDPVPISPETWIALAGDADARVREIVGRCASLVPAQVAPQVFEILARDQEDSVLQRFDSDVMQIVEALSVERIVDYLPGLRARHDNSNRPYPKYRPGGRFFETLSQAPLGYAALRDWALAGDARARNALLEQAHAAIAQDKRKRADPSGRSERQDIGIYLDDAQLVDFVKALAAEPESNVSSVMWDLGSLRIEDPAPWRALAADGQQAVWLRLHALSFVVEPRDEPLVLALVSELDTVPAQSRSEIGSAFGRLFERMEDSQAQPLLRRILQAKARAEVTNVIAVQFVAKQQLTPELSDAVLSAALEDPQGRYDSFIVGAALREVARRPASEQGAWFERTIRSARYARDSVNVLADLRDPHYRSLLVDTLNATNQNADVRSAAISALGRYLDDESVEILLDAAARFEPGPLRDQCYAELDRIRTHREQRAAWEQRKRAGATKDAAIGQIVPLLDSPDAAIRVQAVRSLATLGAVEELPRVLQLVKDPDPAVRAAAQRTLEVLNASTAAPR